MKFILNKAVFSAFALVHLLLAQGALAGETPATASGVPANEASATCLSLGGKIETYEINGQEVESVSFCRFDGAGIGEWTLLNAITGKNEDPPSRPKAIEAFLNHVDPQPEVLGMLKKGAKPPKVPEGALPPEPALKIVVYNSTRYCVEQANGKILELPNGVKACIFEDSAIDADTLLAGPTAEKNAKLTQVLKSVLQIN